MRPKSFDDSFGGSFDARRKATEGGGRRREAAEGGGRRRKTFSVFGAGGVADFRR
jgi:hypothetical protein